MAMLLEAGADPTIKADNGARPFDVAAYYDREDLEELLEAAMAEPRRSRLLFKARALIDTALAVPKARLDAQSKGLPPAEQQAKAAAAAPLYMRERVAEEEEELPWVEVVDGNDE